MYLHVLTEKIDDLLAGEGLLVGSKTSEGWCVRQNLFHDGLGALHSHPFALLWVIEIAARQRGIRLVGFACAFASCLRHVDAV